MDSKPFTRFALGSILATSVLAIACGGTVEPDSSAVADAGGDSAETGSVPSKKLAEMSDPELSALCSQQNASYNTKVTAEEQTRIGCAFQGVFAAFDGKTDSEAQQKCQQTYDACLGAPHTPEPAEDNCTKFVTSAKTCTNVTTTELLACTDAQIAAMKTLAAPTYCSTLKVGSTGEVAMPACDVVRAKCPALFGGESPG